MHVPAPKPSTLSSKDASATPAGDLPASSQLLSVSSATMPEAAATAEPEPQEKAGQLAIARQEQALDAPATTESTKNQAFKVTPLLDREASMLAFNERVLAQALRPDVPLLERLRYLTIVSSNLDEFFEVRFPDVLESLRAGDDPAARPAFDAISQRAHALIESQYQVFNDALLPALAAQGIHILNHAERNPAQRRWVAQYFENEVRPLLMPVALDPAHPFPMVANKSLNFIMRMTGPDLPAPVIAILKVPRALPRVIRLPARLMPEGEQGFVLLTSVIRAHLADLLPQRTVEAFSQFRVTRDSDLDVDEDDVTNLRQALRTGLTTRHFGQAIRLEVVNTCPPELSQFLLEQFSLPRAALYSVNGPVNLVRLGQLIDQADGDSLRFARFEPSWPQDQWQRGEPVFQRLTQGDILLHHPFQSFEPVVEFLRQAVNDPQVLAIKQTIYRTGSESVLMDLLIEAVRQGKEVTVVLELKARFDEEANINWAERLEALGAQVVYGLVGLKTHAKLLLVTRREALPGAPRQRPRFRLRRYGHLSTGNYNPRTARLYTDLGLLTANPEMTADMDAVFLHLASQAPMPILRRLLVAPTGLQTKLLEHLAQVASAARQGLPARVVAKVNALTDPLLINSLLATAQAGAEIDLIVRGACMLRPGLPGLSDRIRVRAIVGRFLEHTRVLYFRWGPDDSQEGLYLSSADWMSRNMLRRVEVAWPVEDPTMRQRVIDEALVPYLHDQREAWELRSDGRYLASAPEGETPTLSAQQALLTRYGRFSSPNPA